MNKWHARKHNNHNNDFYDIESYIFAKSFPSLAV